MDIMGGWCSFMKLGWQGMLLVAVFACAPTHAQSKGGKRVALLIGNADYKHEKKLRNPVNDAKLLARVFKEELQFDDVKVLQNLNVVEMDKAIADLAKWATGADSVVFYFSGHGMKDHDRHNYLLPVEARTGFDDSPELERQALTVYKVRNRLKELNARVTLMILDACRDGPGGGKSLSKGLAKMGGESGLLVAYAAEEDKVAMDGIGKNSPYAEALARAFELTNLSILEQFDVVADEVKGKVPGQSPTREGNLRVDAYLIGGSRPNRAQREAHEDEAWKLCAKAITPVPCIAYLDRYPKGRYSDLVPIQVTEFAAKQKQALMQSTTKVSEEGLPVTKISPKGFQFIGNTVFSDDQLAKLVAPYIGKEVDFEGLKDIVDVIKGYYRSKGYFLAIANLLKQDASDGIVKINILEGRIGKIRIRTPLPPNSLITENEFRRLVALNLKEGDRIIEKSFEGGILQLRNWSGMVVNAIINPGEEIGTADIDLEVTGKMSPTLTTKEL